MVATYEGRFIVVVDAWEFGKTSSSSSSSSSSTLGSASGGVSGSGSGVDQLQLRDVEGGVKKVKAGAGAEEKVDNVEKTGESDRGAADKGMKVGDGESDVMDVDGGGGSATVVGTKVGETGSGSAGAGAGVVNSVEGGGEKDSSAVVNTNPNTKSDNGVVKQATHVRRLEVKFNLVLIYFGLICVDLFRI
jgi:hypothetical protein